MLDVAAGALLKGIDVDESLVRNHPCEGEAVGWAITFIVVACIEMRVVLDGEDLFEQDQAVEDGGFETGCDGDDVVDAGGEAGGESQGEQAADRGADDGVEFGDAELVEEFRLELDLVGRGMGVRFALDDFGTGYSTLSYLKRLPVDVLKIDRSFVHHMLDDAQDLAMVEGVIGLARTFGGVVVAEGVESPAQARTLLELGCDIGQGTGIAAPMPASAVSAWIRDYKGLFALSAAPDGPTARAIGGPAA